MKTQLDTILLGGRNGSCLHSVPDFDPSLSGFFDSQRGKYVRKCYEKHRYADAEQLGIKTRFGA